MSESFSSILTRLEHQYLINKVSRMIYEVENDIPLQAGKVQKVTNSYSQTLDRHLTVIGNINSMNNIPKHIILRGLNLLEEEINNSYFHNSVIFKVQGYIKEVGLK